MRLRIGLIAGIGPATHRLMSMADLARGCVEEGLAEARTLLATGNLVFRSGLAEEEAVAAIARVLARHGVDRAIYVRDGEDLAGIIAANPFDDAARDRPNHLLCHFCAHPVTPSPDWEGPERIAVAGREVLIDYVDGVGASRLTGGRLKPAHGASWHCAELEYAAPSARRGRGKSMTDSRSRTRNSGAW